MNSYMDFEKVQFEITGMPAWLENECGIPKTEVRGFRNPYLTTAPSTRKVRAVGAPAGGAAAGMLPHRCLRCPAAPPGPVRRGPGRHHTRRPPCGSPNWQVLHERGFLYDSTLIEGKGYSLSYGMGERVWPCERVARAWGLWRLGRAACTGGGCMLACGAPAALPPCGPRPPPTAACPQTPPLADTLDFGIPQNCRFYSPGQTCDVQEETLAGLWEVRAGQPGAERWWRAAGGGIQLAAAGPGSERCACLPYPPCPPAPPAGAHVDHERPGR